VELGKQIDRADSVKDLEEILSVIKPLERDKMIEGIKDTAIPLIEGQRDLAVLDTF